ncbi:MAG: DUF2203 domain-containing protein [Cyanobacteria bacterium J06639_16]
MDRDKGNGDRKPRLNASRQGKATRDISPEDLAAFEGALREVDQSLRALKRRYVEIRRAQTQRAQLVDQAQQPDLPQDELLAIGHQIEQLEATLESKLFHWAQLKEPFWQVIRFSGLGIILGWILKSCAG